MISLRFTDARQSGLACPWLLLYNCISIMNETYAAPEKCRSYRAFGDFCIMMEMALTLLLTLLCLKIDVIGELFTGLLPFLFSDMSVYIHGCLDVRVSEAFLHFLQGCTGLKEQ